MNFRPDELDPTDDPLTESLLRELIGNESPPDLKERILSRFVGETFVGPINGHAVVSFSDVPTGTTIPARRWRIRRRRHWTSPLFAAACLLLLVSVLGLIVWKSEKSRRMAVHPAPPTTGRERNQVAEAPEVPPRNGDAVSPPTGQRERDAVPEEAVASRNEIRTPPTIDAPRVESLPLDQYHLFSRTELSMTPSTDDDIIAFIDANIRQKWTDARIKPTQPLSDKDWCERLFASLLDRPPTAKEVRQFMQENRSTRRGALVARLLDSEEYREEFTKTWSRKLAYLLFRPREIAGHFDAVVSLLDRHLRNRIPYRETVRELVIGSTLDVVQVTHAFSGEQLKCASCHHKAPDARIPETRYMELTLEFGTPGRSKRKDFAEDLSRSDAAREVIINRMWWDLLGYGLVVPDADVLNKGEVSHPELVSRLSNELLANDMDLRKLITWIVSTEAFGLSPPAGYVTSDLPGHYSVASFNRSYRREYLATTIHGSLARLAAIDVKLLADPHSTDGTLAVRSSLPSVDKPVKETDKEKLRDEDWQAIEMLNRDVSRFKIAVGESSFLYRIANSEIKPEHKLEHVFFATVGRGPSQDELKAGEKILKAQSDNLLYALRDIWCAILKSNEGTRP